MRRIHWNGCERESLRDVNIAFLGLKVYFEAGVL